MPDFIDECITWINNYRRIHQVSPLKHNPDISATAQKWADQMARTGSLGANQDARYNGKKLGENRASIRHRDKREITGRLL